MLFKYDLMILAAWEEFELEYSESLHKDLAK